MVSPLLGFGLGAAIAVGLALVVVGALEWLHAFRCWMWERRHRPRPIEPATLETISGIHEVQQGRAREERRS